MSNKILIRLIGALACLAVVGTAWDAEAGHRRHHRRACCYTEPCCVSSCAPVCNPCCAPVAVPACSTSCCQTVAYRSWDPCCETRVVAACNTCGLREYCGCAIVQREVIVPTCCQAGIVTEGVVIATKTKEPSVKLAAQPKAATSAR